MSLQSEYNKELYLIHAGKKGMKWGFNYGKKNGKRTAGEILDDLLGKDEYEVFKDAEKEYEDAIVKEKETPRAPSMYIDRDAHIWDEVNKKYDEAYKARVKAGEEFYKARKEYYTTPLGVVDTLKGGFKKAKKWVGELFVKIGNRIKD